ncbi:uncharacterized protein YraI [Angulomicrobium tetraedrale]|uniref:Uncharacterized protein YraI n=1 Tax=Ancylobacter tetraedralis TaxID=217068 RepID=A0A839Z9Q5_9HYPH|nr:SH3 domain-containing protein [Ancylobacter tetraedralis]MBB3771459.1 uncharacterized protein YraI [Ancylobacter tetraedralis]
MRFTTSFARASGVAVAGTLTAGTIAAGTLAAFAAPATMGRTAELRGGPGANYAMLGTLVAGTPVDVVSCAGAWCRTQYGYVSAGAVLQGAPALPQPMAVPGVSGAAALGYAPGTAAAPVLAAGTGGASDNASMAGPRTTIGTANVRSGPGTDYDITRTLPDATKVEVTGCANGWCQTNEGYISLYVLSRGAVAQVLPPQAQPSTSADGAPATPANAIVTRNATVRSGPGGRYGVLGTLPSGFPVSVVSCAGSWCQTQYGYVSARQIARAAPGPGGAATAAPSLAPPIAAPPVAARAAVALAPTSAMPAASGAAALGYGAGAAAAAPVTLGAGGASDNASMAGPRTTIGTANVRSGPGTDYDITGTLPDATKVEVTGCANGWCQTNEGYISLYVLSRGAVAQVLPPQAQPPQTLSPQTLSPQTQPNMSLGVAPGVSAANAATTASVKARSGPGVRYGVLGTLPAGMPVNIESCAGAWCRTQYGYVSVRHVSIGRVSVRPVAPSATRDQPVPAIGTAPMAQAATGAPIVATDRATAAAPAGRAYAPGIGMASAPPATSVPISRAAAGSISANSAIEAGLAPVATTAATTAATVTTAAANIRSGPGTGYAVTGTLAAGTKVDLAGCDGAWCETPYGYVNARRLAAGPAMDMAGAPAGTTRVVVRPASLASAGYANASYVDPSASYPTATQTPTYVSYPGETVPGGTYPIYPAAGVPTLGGAVLATLAAPVVGVAAAVGTVVDGWTGGWDRPTARPALYVGGGYVAPVPRYGYGWDSTWRASWGPGYWGPGLDGANRPSYWGARPSYWGGRPTYWNMHPGYGDAPRFGDRAGNTYGSRRGEGALPQRASFYSGLGPHWQGPYAAGPWYDGRPVVWRP